jgi:flagellar biosynthesis GTPase FlhF
MAKSLDYVFNPIYHKEGENIVIRVENGLAQVKDIGTGFMMIRRSVIKKMMEKYPDTKYRNNVAGYGKDNMNDYFYSLFDCIIDPVSRVYLSEDYLFCKRWIDIGGELWLDISTNLNHTGLLDYKGCLGITIGEVDVLNKDAQIMKEQMEREKKYNEIKKKVEEAKKLQEVSASSSAPANVQSSSEKKKKKKKKNKKNNNNNNNTANETNTSDAVSANNNDDDNEEEETESEEEITNQNTSNVEIKIPYKNSHC